tara:strand:+ start:277 stop:1968 length:1692 start_codon:yes stop_codon:yes gene_type:complete
MSGVKTGDFNRVTISNDLGVGRRANFGTSGQVLKSGGQGRELTWGSNSATLPEGLTAGANITFNPAGVYNGSVATTISTTTPPDGGITTLNGGDGIIVEDDSATEKTIKADLKSGSGLTFTSGEIDLASIPNSALANSTISGKALGTSLSSLYVGTGLAFASPPGGINYDGSAERTIISTITQGLVYITGGNGINIETPNALTRNILADLKANSGLVFTGDSPNGEIDLVDIPNSALAESTISGKALGTNLSGLTFGTGITASPSQAYDGSTAITITASTNISDLTASDGILITSVGTAKTISTRIDADTIVFKAASPTKLMAVAKVPNKLTAGSGISFSSGTTFDGSAAVTITATTDATTRSITKAIFPTNTAEYRVYRRTFTSNRSKSMLMYPIDTNFNYSFDHTPVSRYYKVEISFSSSDAIAGPVTGIFLEPLLIRLDSDNTYTTGYQNPQLVSSIHTLGGKLEQRTAVIILDLGAGYSTAALQKVFPVVIQQSAESGLPAAGSRDTGAKSAGIFYGGGQAGARGLQMVMTPLSENDVSITEPTSGSPFTIPVDSDDDY